MQTVEYIKHGLAQTQSAEESERVRWFKQARAAHLNRAFPSYSTPQLTRACALHALHTHSRLSTTSDLGPDPMYLCSCSAQILPSQVDTNNTRDDVVRHVNWGPVGWNSLGRAKRPVDLRLRPHS
jgi:hypothetical protein